MTKGEGTLSLLRGSDRRLYIESSEGNFRIDVMEAIPVEDIPRADPETPTLADGSTFRYVDAEQHIHHNLEVTKPDGSTKTFYLDYNAAGTDIFCLHGGLLLIGAPADGRQDLCIPGRNGADADYTSLR